MASHSQMKLIFILTKNESTDFDRDAVTQRLCIMPSKATAPTLSKGRLNCDTDICEIESPTADKAGVDAVGDFCAAFAQQRGWRVERAHFEKAGDVHCFTMNPDAKAAPLALSGHMDTVHEKGSFGYPAVTEDEKMLYGPGVTDCKGGIVVAMLAMAALQDCGFTARPIQLLLQSEEEVASAQTDGATMAQLCEWAKDAVGFLNFKMTRSHG